MKIFWTQNHIRFNIYFRSTRIKKNHSENKIKKHVLVQGNIVEQEVNSSRIANITDTLRTVEIPEIVVFDETKIDIQEGVLQKESSKSSRFRRSVRKTFYLVKQNKEKGNETSEQLIKLKLNSLFSDNIRE